MMLTALQAQLELGDVDEVIHDYRPIACHCLPARIVPTVPPDGVQMHHQSLRGMTASEAKQAFLNLIQSWPLHKATIFDVMVIKPVIINAQSTLNISSNLLHLIGLEFYGWQSIRKDSTYLNIDQEILYVLTIIIAFCPIRLHYSV